jgi:hypothetical protein
MSQIVICQSCFHPDNEHFHDSFGYPRDDIACSHDDYYDDGGERIHDWCKCKGFKTKEGKIIYPKTVGRDSP